MAAVKQIWPRRKHTAVIKQRNKIHAVTPAVQKNAPIGKVTEKNLEGNLHKIFVLNSTTQVQATMKHTLDKRDTRPRRHVPDYLFQYNNTLKAVLWVRSIAARFSP